MAWFCDFTVHPAAIKEFSEKNKPILLCSMIGNIHYHSLSKWYQKCSDIFASDETVPQPTSFTTMQWVCYEHDL